MNGWAIAGWVMLVTGSTVFVARLFGMKMKGKPPSYGGTLMAAIAGYVLASSNHALPETLAWLFGWLGVVAVLSLFSRIQPWYQRYKAIRMEQKMAALSGMPAPGDATLIAINAGVRTEPLTDLTGLNFDILLTYGARGGKQPVNRRVTIHEVHASSGPGGRVVAATMKGYCHLRKGPRTFIVSRIIELAEAATGEIIFHPEEWLLERAHQAGT